MPQLSRCAQHDVYIAQNAFFAIVCTTQENCLRQVNLGFRLPAHRKYAADSAADAPARPFETEAEIKKREMEATLQAAKERRIKRFVLHEWG